MGDCDMKTRKWSTFVVAMILACGCLFAVNAEENPAKTDKQPAVKKTAKDEKAVSLPEARRRAKLLHETYTATLGIMHRYYFKDGQIVVPSRALEDVFYRIAIREKIKANWIAVNAQAMSIEHKPDGEFEKQAAAALRSGKNEFEQIADGEYRRVGSVILFGDCVNCHKSSARSLVAGLVIRMPMTKE
jgi:hypothetical protein